MTIDLLGEVHDAEIKSLFDSDVIHADAAATCETQSDEFVKLFGAHRGSIEVYLRTLLPTAADVDDVFQETSLVLWREFQGFTLGTNFLAWACAIAFNRVRAWRSRRDRESLRFSNALSLEISDELISHSDLYDARLSALSGCISQLKPHHREILRRRYELGESIESIASSTSQSIDAVYQMLSRIRHQLFECVSCRTKTCD